MPGVIRTNKNGALQLTPNFYLSEFIDCLMAERFGIDNSPDPLAVANLYALAQLLEKVRKLLKDQPVQIVSGFQSVALADFMGIASPFDDHLRGSAADFICPRFGTALQVADEIQKSSIPFGLLRLEGSFVHLELGTARAVQTVKFGTDDLTIYEGLVS